MFSLPQTIETCKERYGANYKSEFALMSAKVQKEKYGDNRQKIIEKSKKTCKERYGVENPYQIKEVISRIQSKKFKNRQSQYPMILGQYKNNYICKCEDDRCELCDKDQFLINKVMFYHRITNNRELCPIKNKPNINKSTFEYDLLKFIKLYYNGEVLHNDRVNLHGQEIDIYIPELKIGIECNGVYWHSELYKDPTYHIKKQQLASSLGIKLIFI